jgi:hypothetical protein
MTSVMYQEYPEDGGSRLLLNVDRLAQIPNYTASVLGRPKPCYQLLQLTITFKLSFSNRFFISLPICVFSPSCTYWFYYHCKVNLFLCYEDWEMAVCLPAFLIYITEGGGQQSSSYLCTSYRCISTKWSSAPAFFWRFWRKDKSLFLPAVDGTTIFRSAS